MWLSEAVSETPLKLSYVFSSTSLLVSCVLSDILREKCVCHQRDAYHKHRFDSLHANGNSDSLFFVLV